MTNVDNPVDDYWKCSDDSTLTDDSHTLPTDCNATPFGSTTWNDCVSSYTVWVPAGLHFCLYQDVSYGNLKADHPGPISEIRYDVGVGWNDALSSFKWVSGTCPG